MTTREELMRVVLDLPEDELDDALRLIDKRDRLARRLDNAPFEEEDISPEEEEAAAEGRADVAAGRVISHKEMLRKYDLA